MRTSGFYGALLVAALVAILPVKAGEPKKEITINLSEGWTITFVRIEAGDFLMGAPDSDVLAHADEKPQRKVKITKPFYLGKYEVTRGQFGVFANSANYVTHAERDHHAYNWRKPGHAVTNQHPIAKVSWNDAKEFCAWLSKQRSVQSLGLMEVRLPTEAEWEYACRAGTTTRYYSGDQPQHLRGIANLADLSFKRTNKFTTAKLVPWDDCFDYTAPVGQFKPNQFGLYDMIGNVGEWCEDYYGPYKDLPAVDPLRSKSHDGSFGKNRVWRGGDFGVGEVAARASERSHELIAGGDCDSSIGFRVLIRLQK